MTDRLSHKTILITGAGSGIGRAIADRFMAERARVVYSDRDHDAAHNAAGDHERARSLIMDISDEGSVINGFEELINDDWAPDVVVANAGVQLFGYDAPIADAPLDAWRRTIDTNLTGTFLTVRQAVRTMLPRGGGSIILTGSPTGLNGEGKDFTAYSSSKAGIHGLGRAVAAAYAAQGIRVNTVVPGYTETPLVASDESTYATGSLFRVDGGMSTL